MLLSGIYYGKTPIVRAYKSGEIIWSMGKDRFFASDNDVVFNYAVMITDAALAAIQTEYDVAFDSDAIVENSNSGVICPTVFLMSNSEVANVESTKSASTVIETDIGTNSSSSNSSLPSSAEYVNERTESESNSFVRAIDSSSANVCNPVDISDQINVALGPSSVYNVSEYIELQFHLDTKSISSTASDIDETIISDSDNDINAQNTKSHASYNEMLFIDTLSASSCDSAVGDVSESILLDYNAKSVSDESAIQCVNQQENFLAYNEMFPGDPNHQSIVENVELPHNVIGSTADVVVNDVNMLTKFVYKNNAYSAESISGTTNTDTAINNLSVIEDAQVKSSQSQSEHVGETMHILADTLSHVASANQNNVDEYALIRGPITAYSKKANGSFINEMTTHNMHIMAQSLYSDVKIVQDTSGFGMDTEATSATTYQTCVDEMQMFDSELNPIMDVPNVAQVDTVLSSKLGERLVKGTPIDGVFRSRIKWCEMAHIDSRSPLYYNAQAQLWSEVKSFMRRLSGQDLVAVQNIISKDNVLVTVNKTLDGFITDLCLRHDNYTIVVSSNILNAIIDIVMQDQSVVRAVNNKLINIKNIVAHAYNMCLRTGSYGTSDIVVAEWDKICSVANVIKAACRTIAMGTSPIEGSCAFSCRVALSVDAADDWEWPVQRWNTDLLITQVLKVDKDGKNLELL